MSATVAAVREDWLAGRWSSSLPARAWSASVEEPSPAAFALAVEIRHAIGGLESRHIQLVSTLLRASDMHAPAVELRLVSAELSARAESDALRRLDGLFAEANARRFPGTRARRRLMLALALARLPRVLDLAMRKRHDRLPLLIRPLGAEAVRLLARESAIDRVLLPQGDQATGRIAVVGNGPSLLGSGGGASIDSASRVIRFNAAKTDPAHSVDVGQRTDVIVLSPQAVQSRTQLPAAGALISGIDPFGRPSAWWRRLARCRPEAVSAFPDALWHGLVAELEAPPSAGLLTLAWLASQGVWDTVELHGFDTLADEFDPERANHYGDDEPRSSRHDWMRERATLARLRPSQASSPKSS